MREDDYGEYDVDDFVFLKQVVACPISQRVREDDYGEYDVDDFV